MPHKIVVFVISFHAQGPNFIHVAKKFIIIVSQVYACGHRSLLFESPFAVTLRRVVRVGLDLDQFNKQGRGRTGCNSGPRARVRSLPAGDSLAKSRSLPMTGHMPLFMDGRCGRGLRRYCRRQQKACGNGDDTGKLPWH